MTQHPEVSRRIQVRTLGAVKLGATALEFVVEATDAECAALARRLDIPSVQSMRCRFRLSGADTSGRVTADGLLHAELHQVCVATLEDFPATVAEQFTVRFVPDDQLAEGDDPLDLDEDDDVPYSGGAIDVGEAAVEQLALGLDPYPRKPGAQLPPGIGSVDVPDHAPDPMADHADAGDGSAPERPNPFAVLARRRRSDS